jgi:hypothetical protein
MLRAYNQMNKARPGPKMFRKGLVGTESPVINSQETPGFAGGPAFPYRYYALTIMAPHFGHGCTMQGTPSLLDSCCPHSGETQNPEGPAVFDRPDLFPFRNPHPDHVLFVHFIDILLPRVNEQLSSPDKCQVLRRDPFTMLSDTFS